MRASNIWIANSNSFPIIAMENCVCVRFTHRCYSKNTSLLINFHRTLYIWSSLKTLVTLYHYHRFIITSPQGSEFLYILYCHLEIYIPPLVYATISTHFIPSQVCWLFRSSERETTYRVWCVLCLVFWASQE